MLLRFSVTNFRSISDQQEMLLTASKLSGGEADLLASAAVPKHKVLPVAIMYGANAAGKSNFLEAFRRMVNMIIRSHSSGGADTELMHRPFKLDSNFAARPTEFSVDFAIEKSQFIYQFSYTKAVFVSEELLQVNDGRTSLLFRRTGDLFVFGRKLKGSNNAISNLTRPNSLFLSAAAQNNHPLLTKIHTYFSNIGFESSATPGSVQAQIRINNEMKNHIPSPVIEFLSNSGTGIVSYKTTQPEQTEEELNQKAKFIGAIRHALSTFTGRDAPEIPIDDDVEIKLGHISRTGDTVYFDLSEESAGTKRLLASLPSVFSSLKAGTVMCVDEIDASLHTHVAALIIALFSNKDTNPFGAQLIATTHDTNLLRSPHLRRDQIWFAEKDGGGATNIFSLSEFKIRATDDMEKAYLQGRFGAVPIVSTYGLARSLLEGAVGSESS